MKFATLNAPAVRILNKVLQRDERFMAQMQGAACDHAFDGGEFSDGFHARVIEEIYESIVESVANRLHVPPEYLEEQARYYDCVMEYKYLTSGDAK